MSTTQLLFSFQGRLNRKPYWTMVIGTPLSIALAIYLAQGRRRVLLGATGASLAFVGLVIASLRHFLGGAIVDSLVKTAANKHPVSVIWAIETSVLRDIAIILVLYIPLIWIGLALSAKRLHDRDKSAWWLLVFYALPTILSTAADRTEDVQFIILHLISFGITVWAFVELGCLRGTVGSNRYGPDPLSAPA